MCLVMCVFSQFFGSWVCSGVVRQEVLWLQNDHIEMKKLVVTFPKMYFSVDE